MFGTSARRIYCERSLLSELAAKKQRSPNGFIDHSVVGSLPEFL
jgi:hypothetical protein